MPPKRTRASKNHSSSPPSQPPQDENAPSPTDSNPSAAPSQAIEDEEMPEEDIQNLPSTSPSSSTSTGPSRNYNALKTHHGQVYSGMAVGGSHTWNYEPGTWTETKEEPDRWRIDYRTDKRRAGRKAPGGSGAPVGTEYHWLIVGHQMVKKTDANTYETHLTGSKYKLAYKSANSSSWSVPTVKKQRDREVELLEDAKMRVLGRPPVLASERVRVEAPEKGQQSLDMLFKKGGGGKRKREGDGAGNITEGVKETKTEAEVDGEEDRG